jgi:hypothetical protein
MRATEFIVEAVKQRLDAKCWKGKHKEGTKIKGGVRVNNCVPNESVAEAFDQPYNSKWGKSEHGDYDVLAKLPDGTNLSIMFNNEGDDEWQVEFYRNNSQEVTGEGDAQRVFATVLTAIQKFIKKHKPWRLIFSASKEVEAGQNSQSRAKLYDRLVQRYANAWGYEMYHEDHGDQVTYELTRTKQSVEETAAWKRKEGKNKKGGLNAKGVASYRRENPGSKLQTAVTTKPSKLKPGSKDAKRRKSFCARMGGMKGAMKKPNGDPTRKALALRKWNCESVEHMVDMILENMDHDKDNQAVPELKAALLTHKAKLQSATDDQVYDIIDSIMTRIAKSHGISGQALHDMWADQYDQIPDTWIMK